jgi:signal transduction histidine kinase
VEVTFTDTGRGFSTEALSRCSEFFFSEKEGGMGIGLSVASEIVKAHGGELRVANRVEGGARVTVSLPAHHIAPTASGSES